MRLTFYADKPNEDQTPIMVNIAMVGQRFRLGTGVSVESKFWNQERQEFRSTDPNRNAHAKLLEWPFRPMGIHELVSHFGRGMKITTASF